MMARVSLENLLLQRKHPTFVQAGITSLHRKHQLHVGSHVTVAIHVTIRTVPLIKK